MLGIPPEAHVDTAYLKTVVGFYPFDLATASPEPIREEVRIVDRVLHSVVTPVREGARIVGAIVVLRDLGDTAEVARRRAEFAQVMSHELADAADLDRRRARHRAVGSRRLRWASASSATSTWRARLPAA